MSQDGGVGLTASDALREAWGRLDGLLAAKPSGRPPAVPDRAALERAREAYAWRFMAGFDEPVGSGLVRVALLSRDLCRAAKEGRLAGPVDEGRLLRLLRLGHEAGVCVVETRSWRSGTRETTLVRFVG
ncbi:MAG: hypothetical protein K2Q20_02035 [Phycisphaerales bacterium]|nr:hypothetical protein [Phycisphaerales bacterium]